MSNEKIVDTSTTEKEEDVKTTEETTEEKSEEKSEEIKTDLENTIDYKAKYEKMKANAKKAFEERKAKRQEKEKYDDEIEEELEDKPLTKKDLEEFAIRQQQDLEEKLQAEKTNSLISNLTGSEDEANLVNEILISTNFPKFYSLEQRVAGAVALANADKLVGERDEALRALKSKSGASSDASNSTDKGLKNPAKDNVPEDIKVVLKQSGMTYNQETRRYERKIANGKTLFYNEKTKKQELA